MIKDDGVLRVFTVGEHILYLQKAKYLFKGFIIFAFIAFILNIDYCSCIYWLVHNKNID